jgi:MoxR-like ATPase
MTRAIAADPRAISRDVHAISDDDDSISVDRDSISVDRDSISVDRDSISVDRDSISVDRDSISDVCAAFARDRPGITSDPSANHGRLDFPASRIARDRPCIAGDRPCIAGDRPCIAGDHAKMPDGKPRPGGTVRLTPSPPAAVCSSSAPAASLSMSPMSLPGSVDETLALLGRGEYVADRGLATALFLALTLGRPLLLEGEAGVGKTEIAKVLARTLGRTLIRLQCYEGLDQAAAVYEWNYARQMIEIRLAEAGGRVDAPGEIDALERDIFSERFLIKRPLLQALEPHPEGAPVLLIDELDRTDEPFEAFLLEVLSDFQITIPELGSEVGAIRAAERPIVVVTSNRTREIHDALKRRCFYAWIDYPDAERERAILAAKVPAAPERLTRQVVGFVQALRASDLFKLPGVAETIDWTHALLALNKIELDPETVDATLGLLLKYQDDIAKIRGQAAGALLAEVHAALDRDDAP